MHNRKFLRIGLLAGGAVLAIAFVTAFAWQYFSPGSASDILSDAGSAAVQTWNAVISGAGTSSIGNTATIIAVATSSFGENNNGSTGADVGSATDTDTGIDTGADGDTGIDTGAGAAPSSNSSTAPLPIVSTSSSAPVTSSCSFSFSSPSATLSRSVIFNEIAWMGSSGVANGEWMELKNISTSAVDLSGWELVNTSGKIKIVFTPGDNIPAGGLLLLARASTTFASGAVPQKTYSGDLRNAGDDVALIDASCDASDFIAASASGWPAGNNTTKQTMERAADGAAWQTSAAPGGTPGEENSIPLPPAQYTITVSFNGSGTAAVTSDPGGMTCASVCVGSYPSGTTVMLAVTHSSSTAFLGWSGLCYSQSHCVVTLKGNVELVAEIRLTSPQSGAASDGNDVMASPVVTSSSPVNSQSSNVDSGSNSSSTSTNTSSGVAANHLLIAAVQIAGATASNDLVKIYNPTASTVDISSWKLHKKSSTGGDASIREFPVGTTIAPGQYFVWANSADGFAASVGADTSSTQTLSADNSVALLDANGDIVDAIAWGTGTSQYGEGPPYATDPGANQMLVRQSPGGVMVDTDNNANDFTLQ